MKIKGVLIIVLILGSISSSYAQTYLEKIIATAQKHLKDFAYTDDQDFVSLLNILLSEYKTQPVDLSEAQAIKKFSKRLKYLKKNYQVKVESSAIIKRKEKVFVIKANASSDDEKELPTERLNFFEQIEQLMGIVCDVSEKGRRSTLTQVLKSHGINFLVHQFPCENLEGIIRRGGIYPGGGKANFEYEESQIDGQFRGASPTNFVFFNLANDQTMIGPPRDITGKNKKACALYFPLEMIDRLSQGFRYLGDGWQYGTGVGTNVTTSSSKKDIGHFIENSGLNMAYISMLHEVVFQNRFLLKDALFLKVDPQYADEWGQLQAKLKVEHSINYDFQEKSLEETLSSTGDSGVDHADLQDQDTPCALQRKKKEVTGEIVTFEKARSSKIKKNLFVEPVDDVDKSNTGFGTEF